MQGKVHSLNIGQIQPMTAFGREMASAIFKKPQDGPIYLHTTHFAGDEQADLRYHGGPDRAVCVYSYDHFHFWEKELGFLPEPGLFGENMTLTAMTEQEVNVGDLFSVGEAVVQVTQPRQPCIKLAARLGKPEMVKLVQATGYTGYYLRVLQEGIVKPGDVLECINRHPSGVSVHHANLVMYGNPSRQEIEKLMAVDALSEDWQRSLEKALLKNYAD